MATPTIVKREIWGKIIAARPLGWTPPVVNLVSHQLAVGSSEAAFCNEAEAHQLAVGSEAAFRNEAEGHQLAVDGTTVEDTTVEDTTDSNVVGSMFALRTRSLQRFAFVDAPRFV